MFKWFIGFCAAMTMSTAMAVSFPLTIEHTFGKTVIETQPQRVATLDYSGADDLLALGIQPVAIRYWYGDFPKTLWPWASDYLNTQPTVIGRSIDYEALAAARPDVILALWSGIDERAYQKLSLIAPVVAVPKGRSDYGLAWDERALLAGEATGRLEQAKVVVGEIQARFKAARQAYPQWSGQTASVVYAGRGDLGVFGAQDVRPQTLAELGFKTPEALTALMPPGRFYVDLSREALPLIDANVIFWFSANNEFTHVKRLPGRSALSASHIFVDDLLAGAFSHSSLLSLPYVLDRLVPAVGKALSTLRTVVDLTAR
ncbi:MAG: iron-siderophore ABC transporter substrate-binding protein [Pontibacterium sp.]